MQMIKEWWNSKTWKVRVIAIAIVAVIVVAIIQAMMGTPPPAA